MYKVIGAMRSRAFRVMWMLEELGQAYEHMPARPGSDEAKAYNPLGKIPALVDGEDVLTDSVAIMTYLADKHGQLTFPAGTVERAKQDALTFWLVDEFDAILWMAAKHTAILPEEHRIPAVIEAAKFEFSRAASVLSDRLEGPFLMGDQITVPDLLACHCLNWAMGVKFPRTDQKLFNYGKSLRERTAFQAAFNKST